MLRNPTTLWTAVLLLLSCAHVEPRIEVDFTPGALTIDGRERTWLAREEGPGAPLLIALHGRGGTGHGQQRLGHLLELAQKEHLTLVLPDGYERSWHDARNVGPAADANVDDVKFLAAVIDEFVKRGADARRVYVMGMSNGGFMTLTLACRLAGRVTAVASVTGAVSKNLAADCAPERPVPVAFFMGTKDPLVPFEGGSVAKDRGEILSASAGAKFFAQKNGCATEEPALELPDVDPDDGTRVALSRFSGCSAPVWFYEVRGGGHTWPGGWAYMRELFIGKTSKDLNATEAAWAFFAQFRRE